MKQIIIAVCCSLLCCSSHLNQSKSRIISSPSRADVHFRKIIQIDSTCLNHAKKEMENRFGEEMIAINCDSTDLYGKGILMETKKSYQSWHGKDLPAPVGGGWLVIIGKDCEIDTLYEQL
jgi:hypothetical protein